MDEPRRAGKGEITALLVAWRNGDREAFDRLFDLVYGELRALARRHRDRDPRALTTTALVHEAYLKLVHQSRVTTQDRAHFFATAARAMRQIVVDQARRKGAIKRGGRAPHTALDEADAALVPEASQLLAVHEALVRLEKLDERLGRLVEMRFFAGLREDEIARILEVSESTVKRDWLKARGFLYRALG